LFKKIKKILGNDFIGPEELSRIKNNLGILDPYSYRKIPDIDFSIKNISSLRGKAILILGSPKMNRGKKLTLNNLRSQLGFDPKVKEPCFYNQDWYLNEDFSKKTSLDLKWYLLKKNVDDKTLSKDPEIISKNMASNHRYPSAILTAYTFFSYYFLNKKILWSSNFIWCSDKDHHGDRIYVGRYIDPEKVNKNGFNIHRHLSITSIYGLVAQIENSNV